METEEVTLDIRMNDLLQQVRRLDEMITFHQQHSGDAATIRQYEFMKADFIDKANQALKAYHVQLIATPVH
ncbi:hypothetical protein [Spirosoma montaniterrae]|uniref:Uncharacterized protein n=1 Tax=Spirosoma montaniterrae TaxID=1178516 RepID=A0A1P9WT87_9BACT|nr:hypothetical protein [Spirosoma montaniterrae]AQG78606.1 hypothetical protein AWR27_04170 [Spirosoma montaniterrae]